MWQRQKGQVGIDGLVGLKNTISAGEVRVHFAQVGAGLAVGTEMYDLHLGMIVNKPNEFASGVTGRSEDGYAGFHASFWIKRKAIIRICA
jgi:hypothetical protein